jgi:integrase/recombinase XerD
MLSFAAQLGYIADDPGRHLRVRKSVSAAARILTEADVQRMLGAETDPRDRVVLRLLYATGIRNSELCALRHRDVTVRKKSIDARVIGKGSKPRVVQIPASVWRAITELKPSAKPDDPLIAGQDGRPIGPRAVHRLVRRAARRIGIDRVSPHWMRHAHASHALDRGAPVHLVQQNLGHASLVTTSGYLHARAGDSSSNYLPEAP